MGRQESAKSVTQGIEGCGENFLLVALFAQSVDLFDVDELRVKMSSCNLCGGSRRFDKAHLFTDFRICVENSVECAREFPQCFGRRPQL